MSEVAGRLLAAMHDTKATFEEAKEAMHETRASIEEAMASIEAQSFVFVDLFAAIERGGFILLPCTVCGEQMACNPECLPVCVACCD